LSSYGLSRFYVGSTREGPIRFCSAFTFAHYVLLSYLCYLVLLFLTDILFDLGNNPFRDLDEVVAEAVAAVKKVTAGKIKARQPR